MRTEYTFDGETGELVDSVKYFPNSILSSHFQAMPPGYDRAEMTVSEGADAEREMFNHFGDDSSWPDGWYNKLLRPQLRDRVTKKSLFDAFGPDYTGPKW